MQSLWMVFGAFCMASASLSIKLASQYNSNAAQAMFFRGLVAFLGIGVWCLITRQSLRTEHPKMHLTRSLTGNSALGLYTYCLTVLPLVTSITLNYTAPVWVALFTVVTAFIHKTKRPRNSMLVCIAASMVGVVLLLKPIFETNQIFEASVCLFSGVLSATAYVQISRLGKTGEPTSRIVFYHALTMLMIGIIWWRVFMPSSLSDEALPYLIANGAFAMCGQLAMTRAYTAGKRLLTSNLMYFTVVFGVIFNNYITHEKIDSLGYIGIVLIVICSIAATVLNVSKTVDNKNNKSNNNNDNKFIYYIKHCLLSGFSLMILFVILSFCLELLFF